MVFTKYSPYFRTLFVEKYLDKSSSDTSRMDKGLFEYVFCYQIAGRPNFVLLRSDSDSAENEKWYRHGSKTSTIVYSMRINVSELSRVSGYLSGHDFFQQIYVYYFYDIKIWENSRLRRNNVKLNLAPLKNIFVS